MKLGVDWTSVCIKVLRDYILFFTAKSQRARREADFYLPAGFEKISAIGHLLRHVQILYHQQNGMIYET
jgi:hypothetical protein